MAQKQSGLLRLLPEPIRRRARLAVVVLIATLLPLVAATGVQAEEMSAGDLTFTYSSSATQVPSGTEVTYTYRIENRGLDMFYRSSLTDSHCASLQFVKQQSSWNTSETWIGSQATAVFTCTTTVTATTTSTANISYYSFNEMLDPLRLWSTRYTLISVPTTVSVTATQGAQAPVFTCQTPTVFVAENAAGYPTMLNNQYQKPTESTFIKIGTTQIGNQKVQYNAMAWSRDTGYIYAISSRPPTSQNNSDWYPYGHLLQIDANGDATDLGEVSGWLGNNIQACDRSTVCADDSVGGLTSGAIHGDHFYVSNASGSGTKWIYRINLAEVTKGVASPTATRISATNTFLTNDFTVRGNYLWGIRNGSGSGTVPPVLLRYNLDGGDVTEYRLPAGTLPGGKTYGAAWTYGNGNLGFSENGSWNRDGTVNVPSTGVYQLAVIGAPENPTDFKLAYNIRGPGSYNNDGTSCVVDNSVDLRMDKTGPVNTAPGSTVTWSLHITNNGPGISSGGVLLDHLPAGYTSLQVPAPYTDMCKADEVTRTIRCHTGVLNPGDSYAIPITATAPEVTGCATNTVTITGNEVDPTGGNNTSSSHTCVTRAEIDVAKTETGAITRDAAGVYRARYSVTVTNRGTQSGTYTQIRDMPRVPSGLTMQSVHWHGVGATEPTPSTRTDAGDYPIGTSTEKTLQPNEVHTYTVVVAFTVASGTNIPDCTADDGGIYNHVTLPEEAVDRMGDNDACQDPRPWINVAKTADSGTGVTGPTDGVYTASYTVSVTNTGLSTGTYGPLTDTVGFDSDLTPVSVAWSGHASGGRTLAAGYTFEFGEAGTSLAPGQQHTYTVAVSFRVTGTGSISMCGDSPAAGSGLFNSVSLPGTQENGIAADNSACLDPPGRPITVQKAGGSGPLAGARFALYDIDPATSGAAPLTDGIGLATGSTTRFVSTELAYNTPYWLVETAAPEGHELLAQPVRFTVRSDGIAPATPVSQGAFISADQFVLNIRDVPARRLPATGGEGPPVVPIGGLVMLLAGLLAGAGPRRTDRETP